MVVRGLVPGNRIVGKGDFKVNFPKAISEFESYMHKFQVRKILYQIIFRGKGPEFDSYRSFAPDDDATLIDWKASLRSNSILAKKYIEERDLHVYFLYDVGSSMLFGSGSKLKAEYSSEMIVALSHLIIGSGDRVGLIMFNEGIVKFLRAAKSRNQLAIISKHLANSSFFGGGVDFEKCIAFALGIINSPYTVFVLVSDFINSGSLFEERMKIISSKFETIALMIRDPFDENLPDTSYQFSIQDPFSNRQMILDPTIARIKYREEVVKNKDIVKKKLKDSHVDLLELDTSRPFSLFLSRFLRQRAKGGLRI